MEIQVTREGTDMTLPWGGPPTDEVGARDEIDGTGYELREMIDGRGSVRTYDIDTGNLITRRDFPTYTAAANFYLDEVAAAKRVSA